MEDRAGGREQRAGSREQGADIRIRRTPTGRGKK